MIKMLFETQARRLQGTHPLAKFPIASITDNQQTLHLAKSSAIAEWLNHHAQRLGRMDLDNAALADDYYWKNFVEASFMPNLALKQIFA